jgi:hypothetical protein
MSSIINASVSSNGIVSTADASGILLCQSNGKNINAMAWANFNGTAATLTNGYNISSITRNSTGLYTLAFTTAMTNANYTVNATGGSANRVLTCDNATTANTTSAFVVRQTDLSGTVQDYTILSVVVFGT